MRELWGSKVPRRCEKTDSGTDVIIWIIAIAIGVAIIVMR